MASLERLAIDWLRTVSQKAVGEQLGLSWDEIHGITERGWSQASSGEVEPLPLLAKLFMIRGSQRIMKMCPTRNQRLTAIFEGARGG